MTDQVADNDGVEMASHRAWTKLRGGDVADATAATSETKKH